MENSSPSVQSPAPGGNTSQMAIALVILGAALTVGYFVFGGGFSDKDSEQVVPSPKPSPVQPIPASWKTWRSDEYGFSFKYPETLKIQPSKDTTQYPLAAKQQKVLLSLSGREGGISLTLMKERIDPSKESLELWLFGPAHEVQVGNQTAFQGGYGDAGCLSTVYYTALAQTSLEIAFGGCGDETGTGASFDEIIPLNTKLVEQVLSTFHFDNVLPSLKSTASERFSLQFGNTLYWYDPVSDHGTKLMDLTDAMIQAPGSLMGGYADYDVSPDKKFVVFAEKAGEFQAVNGGGQANSDIFIWNVKSETRRRLTEFNDVSSSSPEFSQDGNYICYTRFVYNPASRTVGQSERWIIPITGDAALSKKTEFSKPCAY